MSMNFKKSYIGKRVLVIGLGVSGKAAAEFLLNRSAEVVAVDQKANEIVFDPDVVRLCLRGMEIYDEDFFIDVKKFDFIIVSPGIPKTHQLYSRSLEAGLEVIGEVELACREIKDKKVIGITGTNGKTTVVLLTEHVLQKAGFKARALGNIGIPLTKAIDEELGEMCADIFVMELSSFQLETLSSPFLDAAAVLNITPDHLDRYPSMDAYAFAKINIASVLKNERNFFVEDRIVKNFPHLFKKNNFYRYGCFSDSDLMTDMKTLYFKGKAPFAIPYPEKLCRHDVENMMASFLLCDALGLSSNDFFSNFASFQKPPHRIQFVRTFATVNYYDDSKGTNIDAVIRAVEGLEGKIILIAGGVDKGSPYTSWISSFSHKVKAICAIGQAKEKIKSDLDGYIPVFLLSNLEEAVLCAKDLAKSGENILLSPGCSSYDMFKDYAHRGQEFQRIVQAL